VAAAVTSIDVATVEVMGGVDPVGTSNLASLIPDCYGGL
jgi:hypothetical protein